jgi:hypothetical protein
MIFCQKTRLDRPARVKDDSRAEVLVPSCWARSATIIDGDRVDSGCPAPSGEL